MTAAENALLSLLCVVLTVYTILLFVRVIVSWAFLFGFRPPYSGPLRTILDLLDDVTEPILRPLRALIPPDPGGWRRARPFHPHRVRYPCGPADRAELLTEGEGCMRRKKGSEDAPATGDARITPEEVQQVEFRLAFRGYNERDVDAFLDRITEGLSSYREELEGLRSGSGLPLAAVAGSTGDADAIVAGARAEADEIVRRAQEQAAGIRAAAGAGSGDARGAVAPFLNKEREFLQSLGGLVQTHAEEIKQMVIAIRERAEAAAASEAPRPAAPISSARRLVPRRSPSRRASEARPRAPPAMAAAAQPADLEPASAAEIRERLQASEPPIEIGSAEDEQDLAPEASPPIVVESGTEPVFSTEGAPASERRERSLRELFWGED